MAVNTIKLNQIRMLLTGRRVMLPPKFLRYVGDNEVQCAYAATENHLEVNITKGEEDEHVKYKWEEAPAFFVDCIYDLFLGEFDGNYVVEDAR